MSGPSTHDGLLTLRKGHGQRAIVVLHGIRQTREDLRDFATMIGSWLPKDYGLHLYGYNHTAGLEHNGTRLYEALRNGIDAARIDLVGYSMGGLISRLAASETWPSRIHTVVTVATPNRGSISNAELTALGQIGRSIFQLISPLAPRTEGVKDLTRVVAIMQMRRERLKQQLAAGRSDSHQRRYASVPALFYNDDRTEFAFGPSIALSGTQAAIKLTSLKLKLVNMKKAHDGIVTERSNNLSEPESTDFSEVHLTRAAADGNPAICHAVADSCRNHDHSSILKDAHVAHLVAGLLLNDDWRQVRPSHGALDIGTRLYPFDCD
ncbi:esterase/lipase family protein [Flavisphingomonas formosensis]|uniref:esterase/lipase family protein n=1 Tax=Flavisphingomonas formosensis TaxID=861534 RepID=UPI0012F7929E|nr:alpha/beta fold hydrolase [Sphingomonas formosensis]